MEDHVEKFRQADALAQNILRLTRNTLLVNLRFLDRSASTTSTPVMTRPISRA